MTLFFDFGGTLDTHGIHWFDVFYDAYSQVVPGLSKECLWDCYVNVERLLERDSIISRDDSLHEVLSKKIDMHALQLGITPTVIETVKNTVSHLTDRCLQTSKNVLTLLSEEHQLCVVSNFYGNLEHVLDGYGLLHHFSYVIDSGLVGVRKPDTEIYRLALSVMHSASEDSVMIGDSLKNDIIPARQLGLQTIHLCPSALECKPLPNSIVRSLDDIIDLV